MTQRSETRANAAFGRSDLMKPEHFTFPRQSGLAYGYFDRQRRLDPLRAIGWALALSAAAGAVVAIGYAVVV